ncbi:MAG: hypothetical protein JST91_06850 [Actinobacteria bacterium]|nr:hypothetical protein [Actinomycetota bacterium]
MVQKTKLDLLDLDLQHAINGRFLGRRGIFRHIRPDVETAQRLARERGITQFHTMVTVFAYEFHPSSYGVLMKVLRERSLVGELVRWVTEDGEVGYDAEINGTDGNDAGLCEVAISSIRSLDALAKVAGDLRLEWEIITGVYADQGVTWSAV